MRVETAQLTNRYNRIKRGTVPDINPCALEAQLADGKVFVELDTKLAQTTVIGLLKGGILKDESHDKEPITPWSGTDPNSNINCFS
eukprot:9883860-Ditylum_brightwellii.AAC.1